MKGPQNSTKTDGKSDFIMYNTRVDVQVIRENVIEWVGQ